MLLPGWWGWIFVLLLAGFLAYKIRNCRLVWYGQVLYGIQIVFQSIFLVMFLLCYKDISHSLDHDVLDHILAKQDMSKAFYYVYAFCQMLVLVVTFVRTSVAFAEWTSGQMVILFLLETVLTGIVCPVGLIRSQLWTNQLSLWLFGSVFPLALILGGGMYILWMDAEGGGTGPCDSHGLTFVKKTSDTDPLDQVYENKLIKNL